MEHITLTCGMRERTGIVERLAFGSRAQTNTETTPRIATMLQQTLPLTCGDTIQFRTIDDAGRIEMKEQLQCVEDESN